MRRAWGWLAAFLVLAGVTTACQEELTAPAVCPELCPGGNARVFDTVITPLPGADSSYAGYVPRHRAGTMLVSNGLPAGDARAVYRFQPRRDSAPVGDSARPYVVDSALISLNLIRRDTLLDGLKLYLYRIDPATADSEATFASIASQFVPEAIIDSIPVPDTLHNTGPVQTVLQGAELAKVALPVEGDGVLAIGMAMSAPEPSGVRLGAVVAQTAPTFISYVTVDTPDTGTIRNQTLSASTAFNTYVLASPQTPDPNLLTVGGEPSSRALLRFDLPQPIEDSATIVRATMELIPVGPVIGLRTDPPLLEAKALFADLGAKSPVVADARFIVSDTISVGSADTLRLDVTQIVQLWQAVDERPEAIFLSLLPEAASFSRPVFGSTRSETPGPARLRITYLKPFSFETP